MLVNRIKNEDELASLATDWNRLAQGRPFCSWDWLITWWRTFSEVLPGRNLPAELYVLRVVDELGAVVGIMPCYRVHSRARGDVLRFLGTDGVSNVCSEYLTVLCDEHCQEEVVTSLARWLDEAQRDVDRADQWEVAELTAVDAEDTAVRRLASALSEKGGLVDFQEAMCCWRISLPPTWDEYLATLSKSHRKQIRRLDRRYLASGRAVLYTATDAMSLAQGMEALRNLHQKRRRYLGQEGCFASPRFAAFLGEVSQRLLACGQLRLHWLQLDGRPVAVDFHLSGDREIYAYQGGIDPDSLDEEPGRLMTIATIQRAIADGYDVFDFLRGDEAYKAHWRASPRPCVDVRITSSRRASRFRHQIWKTARQGKAWVKRGLRFPRAGK